MKYATLLLGLAALASLSSCCQPYPCPSACCGPKGCTELNTCRKCASSGTHSSTSVHLGDQMPHSAVCPASADHEIIYGVRPGT